MVDDQKANIQSLQNQIAGIDKTKQGVVPLMYKMIDTLDKFVDLDVPMNIDARKERIAGLRDVMGDSDVSVSVDADVDSQHESQSQILAKCTSPSALSSDLSAVSAEDRLAVFKPRRLSIGATSLL